MLELGLKRIGRLVASSPIPWRAVHVAGTNGKGSVCAYTSAMLQRSGVSCGQFTSPHLIDRWDCISLDGKPIDEGLFNEIEHSVMARSRKEGIAATEFEILTATAFEALTRAKMQVGIIEVGLGGRLDATNILRNPLATVITKIGLDHESLLGSNIEEIAYQKAGIMKPGAPCIVDGTNASSVKSVLTEYAKEVNSGPVQFVYLDGKVHQEHIWDQIRRSDYEDHQQMSINLAYEASRSSMEQLGVSFDPKNFVSAIQGTTWPGRLQQLSIERISGRSNDILLDGAHNPQSARVLGAYVDKRMRKHGTPTTWIIAASAGKDVRTMFPFMIRTGDNVVAVEFGPVAGMPWVQPTKAADLLQQAQDQVKLGAAKQVNGVKDALQVASIVADGGPLVVAGSLYLVSDVLRILRDTAG